MDLREFTDALQMLLVRHGCVFSEAGLRRSTKECRDDILGDTLAHGGDVDEPFFNFEVLGDVAVFTFFEADFSIYVLDCEPWKLISEAERFGICEVRACKEYLATQHGKAEPNLVVARNVCDRWLTGAEH